MGISYDKQGLYSRALEYYLRSEELFQNVRDTASMAAQFNNIAVIYKRQGDLEAAGAYYQQSLELSGQMGDSLNMAVTMINKGLLEKSLGHYDLSAALFDQAMAYFKKINYKYAVAVVLHNYGELRAEQRRYDDALKYYDSSQVYSKSLDSNSITAKNYLYTSRIYFKKGDLQKSLENCQNCLDIAEKQGLIEEEKDGRALLSKILEKLGDYQGSLNAFKRYMLLQDSLFSETKNSQINKMKMEFDLSQKDQEINSLKNERKLQQAKSRAEQKINGILTISSVGLLLGLILAVVGYFRTQSLNKRLKTQKEKISEQNEEIRVSQEALIQKNTELERINKEKDEIMAMVAHDLRSPLNQIKGIMHLFEVTGDHFSVDRQQYFDMIMNSIDMLRDRINHTLDAEAINAGKVNLHPEKLAAKDIVEQVYVNFREQAQKKNISLISNDDGIEAQVSVDRNYMIQVYENLVANAIKFSPEEKKVWLSLSQLNGAVRFHVKDEGPGIPEEDQKKLFNKFQRLTAKPTANENSSGLGLAIVKKYVESMNGKVWCESIAGQGAEFIVQFPVA